MFPPFVVLFSFFSSSAFAFLSFSGFLFNNTIHIIIINISIAGEAEPQGGDPEPRRRAPADRDIHEHISEGGMMRLETLIELNFFNSSLSSFFEIDKKFPVEQSEATVSQSTVPSPLLILSNGFRATPNRQERSQQPSNSFRRPGKGAQKATPEKTVQCSCPISSFEPASTPPKHLSQDMGEVFPTP